MKEGIAPVAKNSIACTPHCNSYIEYNGVRLSFVPLGQTTEWRRRARGYWSPRGSIVHNHAISLVMNHGLIVVIILMAGRHKR